MRVNLIGEHGLNAALLGIGLSYGTTSNFFPGSKHALDCLATDIKDKLLNVARRLAFVGNGENKFLRQIGVIVDITASLTWWKQADTYKIGTTAQSESTMHSLIKTPITQERFERPIDKATLARLENLRQKKDFETLINELPCGWLQRRIWTGNYAVLQNIYNQRKNHKLKEWHHFLNQVLCQIEHPEFIMKEAK